jgi:FAD-dependent oxidoreductase domain-containing protein 1
MVRSSVTLRLVAQPRVTRAALSGWPRFGYKPAMDRFDVVVIGGGVVGSSTAMHLAERGVGSLALVDVDLGGRYSSSELNAGGVRATWRTEVNVALARDSIDFFEGVAAEVGFDQKGYLWLYDAAGWPDALAALDWQNRRFGLDVRALDRAGVQAYCPLLDQLDGVAGATLSPRDGLLNPNLLKEVYRARARAAAGAGLRLENYCHVVGIDADAAGVTVRARRFHEFSPAGDQAVKAILCDGGGDSGDLVELRADRVINCTGAWAQRTAALYGGAPPVVPRRRQIAIAHAREVDLRPWGMFVDTSGVYFHREATFVLAGYADPDTPPGFRFKYDGPGWFEERIWPRLAGRISRCAQMRHRSGWAGLYEYTPDCSGIVGGAPGQPRVVEAFGFTGRGAMQSYAVGRAVAELVCAGGFETLDLTVLHPGRFAEGALVHETLHI